jgi:hypothetical protein
MIFGPHLEVPQNKLSFIFEPNHTVGTKALAILGSNLAILIYNIVMSKVKNSITTSPPGSNRPTGKRQNSPGTPLKLPKPNISEVIYTY